MHIPQSSQSVCQTARKSADLNVPWKVVINLIDDKANRCGVVGLSRKLVKSGKIMRLLLQILYSALREIEARMHFQKPISNVSHSVIEL